MLNIFSALYRRIFPRPTVDKALTSFTKAIDTLAVVVADAQQDIEAVNTKIELLEARQAEHTATLNRASKLHAKLSEIIA